MRISILSLLSLCLGIHSVIAQNTVIEGRVTDRSTRQPLEAASVILLQGAEQVLTGYALTDINGKFSIQTSATAQLYISVSYMGYKKQTYPVTPGRAIEFALDQENIALKEVLIRGGRIWRRQDTLKYDLTRFASSKDTYIKDVLKKLPGIHVEDNGQIKYNGKPISNFYVEGLDVTGGRYNQINNNLRADAVKVAEVIEHHQPVKSLQNKVFTDDVALNLKLKPEARAQWIVNTMAGTGYGDDWLYTASANALQLGKTKQTIYNYKTNNTGTDLTTESAELSTGSRHDQLADNGVPQFVPLPIISTPLEKHRLLFNDTHTASANRLFKMNDDKQLRLQLGYTHDRTTQQRGEETHYYFSQDTLLTIENQDYRLRTDYLDGELNFENNTASHYTRNRLTFSGNRGDGLSRITGDETLSQRISTSQLEIKNYFNQLYNKNTYTWGIRSLIRYSYLPSSLQIENKKTEMNVQNAYTNNSLYWLRKRNGLSTQLTVGMRGELASAAQDERYTAHNYMLYSVPQLEWEKGYFYSIASVQLQWNSLPGQSYTQIYANPSLSLRYQLNPWWRASLYGSLTKSAGNLSGIYPKMYRKDYRTLVQNCGIVPETSRQLYSLYIEYKKTVQEFFWTLSLSHHQTRYNLLSEKNYIAGEFLISSVERYNTAKGYSLSTTLSKGIYDWNLKTSLDATISLSKGEQLNQGTLQSYRASYLQCMPRVIWSPSSLFEASYKANISYNASQIGADTHLDPLWNISQRFTMNWGFNKTEIQLSGEHYYNDLSGTQHLNTWLADASVIYKIKKWRLMASVTNLLDKKQYIYTLYSNVESYTSWMNLRPREYLFTMQYQF